jgi:hypothetical protein
MQQTTDAAGTHGMSTSHGSGPASPSRIALTAAVVTFLAHLAGNPHYGFFRDELYFIICGRHPSLGYVDQPPLVPLLAAASQVFGHSLVLLRALPALFAAAGVYGTCLLAAEFGGGAFAQGIAAVCTFFALVLMNFGMKVSPDMVGLWLWPLAALYVVRIARGADPRLWLAVGLIVGVALESKYSVVFFALALVIGLVLTSQRRILWSGWCAAGMLVAVVIALPNLWWQWHEGFPMLQLLENGQHGKNLVVSPPLYILQEVIITNPFLAWVWIVGLVSLLVTPDLRFAGYAYLALIGMMIVLHGKHYYPADVYPILFAAGAARLERWTHGRLAVQAALVGALVVAGLALMPFSMPVLDENHFLAYQSAVRQALHIKPGLTATEHRAMGALPQDWADMHGWPQLADVVGRIYDGLPASQRSVAAVYAANYGEASAIVFFRPDITVLSGHNQYWLWGTHGATGAVIIDVNGRCDQGRLFRTSRLVTTFSAPFAAADEEDIPIMLCEGIRKPLDEFWPSLKDYI